jgi:hypothetical protein
MVPSTMFRNGLDSKKAHQEEARGDNTMMTKLPSFATTFSERKDNPFRRKLEEEEKTEGIDSDGYTLDVATN